MAPPRMSLNIYTVREQWNLREAIEDCARHGVPAIAPWRDKLAELGVEEAARLIADNGLGVSSLFRGGMFPVAGTTRGGRRHRRFMTAGFTTTSEFACAA